MTTTKAAGDRKAALKATLEKSAHQIEEQKAAARAEKKVLKEWGRVQEESKLLKRQAAILQRFHPRTMLGDADTADNPELKSLRKNREAAVEEFCETLDPAKILGKLALAGTVSERYYTAEELRENSRKLREMFVEKLRGVCQMDHDLKSLLLNESCPVDNFWGNVRRVCEDKYGVNHRFAQGFFPWQALSSVVWECNERLGMCVEPFSGRDIREEEVLQRAEDTRYGWVVIMPRYCTPAPVGNEAEEEAGGGNGNGNGSVPAPASSKSKGSPRPISWVKQVNLVRILRWIMIEQGELWKLDAATALNPVARYFDDFHLADRPMMKRLNGVNNVGQGLLLTERVSNAWVHRLTQMREYESLQLKAFKLRLYEALLEYFLKVEVPHVRQLLLGCRKQVPDNKRRFGLLLKKSAELRRKEETAAASKAAARAKSAASASSSVSSKAKGKHITVEQRLGRTATVRTEVHGGVSVTPAMQQRFAALFGGDVYLQCEGNRLHIPLAVQEELVAQVRKLADGENSLMYQLATAKADEQQRAREEGVPEEKQEEAFTADLKLKKKRDKLDELEGLATTVDADAKRQRLERSKRYYTRELKKIESAFPQWSAARERVKNLTEEVKRAERAILVSLDDSLQENLEVPHLWDEEVDEYQGCVFDQAWRLLDEVMHLETQKKGCERALVESLGRGDVHESWRDNALLLRPEAYWCGTERGHLMETLPFLYVPEIMDADCMQQLLSRAPEVFSNRRSGPVPHYTPPLTKPQFPKPVPGDGLRGSSHPFGTKIAPKVRILAAPAPYTEESAAGFVTEIDKGVRDLAKASVTAAKEAKRKKQKAAAEQQGQNKSSALNDPRSYFLKTKVSDRGGPRLPVGGGESHAADGTTRDGSLQGRAASMCRPDGSPRVPDIPLEALLENRDADSCPLRWSAGVRQEEEADTLESVLRDAQLPAPKEEVKLWLPTPDQEARVAQAVEAEAVARKLAAERKKAAQMKKANRTGAAAKADKKASRAKQAKTDQNPQVLGGQQQTHSQLQKEGSRTEKKPQDHDGASSKGGEEPSLLDYLVQRSDLDQSALAQNASASASSRNLSMHFYADGTTTAGEAPSTSTPSHQGGAARGPAAVHAKGDSTTGSGGTAGTSLSLKEKDSSMKINEKPRDVVPPWLRNKQLECDQVDDWRQPAPSKFPSSGAGAYVPPRHGQCTSSSAAQEAEGGGELSSGAVLFGAGSREEKHEAVDHREMGAATATSSSMTQQGLSVSSAGKYRYNYNSATTTSTNAAYASGAGGYPAAGSTSSVDARTSFEYYRYGMAPQDASWRAAQLDALTGVNATGSTGSGTPAAGSWHNYPAPQHATTSAQQPQEPPAFFWFYDAYGTQQIIPANNLPNDARVADTPSMCRETGSSGAYGLYRMTQQEIATVRQYDSFYEHSASGSRSAPQQSGTSGAGGSTAGPQFVYGGAVVHDSCASPVSPGGGRRGGSGVAVSSSGANGSAKGSSSSAAAYATGAHHQAYRDGNQFGGYGAYGASGQYAQHYKNQQAQYHQYAAAGPQSTAQQQNPYTSSAQARTGTGTAGESPPTGSSPIEEAALMAQQQALISQQRALQMATTGYRPPAQTQRLNESLESDYMSDPEADSPELPARGSAQPKMSGSMRLQPPTTSSKDAAQYVPKTVEKMARKIGQTKSFLGISTFCDGAIGCGFALLRTGGRRERFDDHLN
eukprot:g8226.t1